MAGICFYFESSDIDVWSGKNLDAWLYACNIAGDIDQMIVINKTDQEIKTPSQALDFSVVKELPVLKNAIYLTPPSRGGKSLWDYAHDADWYVFGPADGWAEAQGPQIHIPHSGNIHIHAVHVATTVMFDRYRRLQWLLH